MDDAKRDAEDVRDAGRITRRALFGRALAVVGGSAAVLALSGCPGGDQDDDDGDDEDDD
ncbi:hypothetical protein [Paractinoplanes rishiriensis]|uniref:Uncharacterized protein n=1 Tax=Paractinoplanes rishiriensis TaxID=1050105 RepID=A0A919K1V2_9ACTN|nr:hypothetical protein [Actinoplanes rishiriensis]GIE99346.1 hypothetical protein Ari01nite_68110 [Actinoplanes rishiriensis]